MITVPDRAKAKKPEGRLVGLFNIAVATLLAIVVTIVALSASNTNPPAVAEFAPQAVQQIKQAPADQTSLVGRGNGGLGLLNAPPSPPAVALPSPPTIDRGRIRQCIGTPARQIQDPQSPPCVPYWPGGDNGGATSRGVTGTEIRVAVPSYDANCGSLCATDVAFINFLNSRFEFYGRKIVPVPVDASGNQPQQQRAEAVDAAQNKQVFASVDYNGQGGWDYADEMANQHVVYTTGRLAQYGNAYLGKKAPYIWQYAMAWDMEQRNEGEWVCNRFVGGAANHGDRPWLRRHDGRQGHVHGGYRAGLQRHGGRTRPDAPGLRHQRVLPLRLAG